MGAGQSTSNGAETPQEVKTSYYELLGVERQATDDDIKRAYKRKALELHPDRNYGKEEDTTKLFAEVQAAYEVLSDPQERAWYDSHESEILHGADADSDAHYEANIRVTTTDDIARMMKKFNRNVDFSDKPSGFFGFLREFFEQLAKEEQAAAYALGEDAPDYPPFGHKDDLHDDVVKTFYAGWNNFHTQKTFAWKDKWQPSQAPDRRTRRYVEKENQKHRDDAIKEFNEAIRTLIAFVRKRDPRYQPVVKTDEERQKSLRNAAAEQAAKARAQNEAKLRTEDAVPDWAKARDADELEESEEEEEEQEEFECVACHKTFKSEKQFDAHEKSKKHQKAVHALKRKMEKDNKNLHLDEVTSSGAMTPISDDEVEVQQTEIDSQQQSDIDNLTNAVEDLSVEEDDLDDGETSEEEVEAHPDESADAKIKRLESDSESDEDSIDDEYAPRSKVEELLVGGDTREGISEDSEGKSTPAPKLGKAAQKRAKRAAKAAEEQSDDKFKCEGCGATFQSKTRLFEHIKDHPKHASLKSGPTRGKAKKGKR